MAEVVGRALRVAAVVVVDVLVLPDRGRLRYHDAGEAVRELLVDADADAECGWECEEDERGWVAGRGKTYDESTSIALLLGNELSDTLPCSNSGLVPVLPAAIALGFGTAWPAYLSPSVEGIVIVPGSSFVSTYIVSALGAGATRSVRACGEKWRLESWGWSGRSSEGGRRSRVRFGSSLSSKKELEAGRLWLTAASSLVLVLAFFIFIGVGLPLLAPSPSAPSSSAPSPSPNSPSTPREISCRSSIHVLFVVILEDSVRARLSSDVPASLVSPLNTLFSALCVDIDDCSSALDISSACTLRSSRWSKPSEFAL